MGWNADYRDLLAPHYESIERLLSEGPDLRNKRELVFAAAIENNAPTRPLEFAWIELNALPETQRSLIVRSFATGERKALLAKSRKAFEKLLKQKPKKQPFDYHAEMLAQGFVAPSAKADEPLGTRGDYLKDRGRNKFNGG